jgi:predicted methyltransferase
MTFRVPRFLAIGAALCLAAVSGAVAQGIAPLGPAGAPAKAFAAPDRPIAEIISPIWATEKERDAVDEAGQIYRLLGLEPGMSVADLGAGSGYHTIRLSRALGPAGRVFAQDVMPNYLTGLDRRVRREGLFKRDRVARRGARPAAPGGLARCGDPGAHVPRDRPALRLPA